MERSGDQVNAHCNSCHGDRKHTVLFSAVQEWHDPTDEDSGYTYDEYSQDLVIECCGCGNRSFLNRWWNSPTISVTQFPPKTIRKLPDWYFDLDWVFQSDSTKQDLLKEIYAALGTDSRRLAAMGIRALLEHIMIEQVGDHESFGRNLKTFEAKGFISKIQSETLARVLEAGHASMHRGFKANVDDLLICLDVAEFVVASIYVHPQQTKRISIPSRKMLK